MEQACSVCAQNFTLTEEDLAAYTDFGFEPEGICFPCQHRHRLTFRNGRCLYRRTCDKTGNDIVSIYSPDKPFPVYSNDAWMGDSWDALSYGRDVDLHRPFFDQLKELQLEVPRRALLNINSENSEYCNMCVGNKNCYLVFGGDYNEDCMYCTLNMRNNDCLDADFSNENEHCYDLFNTFNSYGSRYVSDSKNCTDCAYIVDCIGCTDCILCSSLKQKQYCIRNQQLTKQQYEVEKANLLNGSWKQHQSNLEEFADLRTKRIVRAMHSLNSEDCTGDYIESSKGCHDCFMTWRSEDVQHAFLVDTGKDSFNCSFYGHGSERCINIGCSIAAKFSTASYFIIESSYCDYSESVINCHNLFGCNGLRQKQYCILNKQYTKEEYTSLREKLVDHMKSTGEWGKYLPKELSCFAYNESTAHEFFPLNKEEALKLGYTWRDEEEEQLDVEKVVPADKLPDLLSDIPDDILNWAVECEVSGKAFRILKQELEFYRKHNIPIPRLHPNERYAQRKAICMNPSTLWDRTCAKCSKDIQTSYSPEWPETVYCEDCYLAEVY